MRLALAVSILVAAASTPGSSAVAQTRSTLEPPAFRAWANTRLRHEWIGNQIRPGFDRVDDIVSLRTIVGSEVARGPFRLGAELYDSRVYDAEPGSAVGTNEVNTLELVQAYATIQVEDVLGPDTSLAAQAGRFVLNLGSRRLVAADDYRNTTNGYTGAKVDLTGPLGTATLIYVQPQVRLPEGRDDLLDNRRRSDRTGDDLVLWGGLFARPQTDRRPLVEISYFRLEEEDVAGRPTRDRDLHTAGGRIMRGPAARRWDFEVEGFWQTGRISRDASPGARVQDVRAGFVHLDAGYTFTDAWKTRVSAEYDWASGDAPGGDYGRFDTLFGMRRADLAPAGLYNAIGRANLSAPGLRIETTPSARLDLMGTVRGLWLAEASDAFSTTGVRDPAGVSGRFAGTQVEARARYWLVPARVRIEGNVVALARAGFLDRAPNAPDGGDVLYVSTALTVGF